ncbi:hypothetical protein B0H12DRAFT_81055 [Mycena haematopus]|nr:hypothetical protein B0H12DRAFT_81055 [Mycena haematopus]
MSRRFPRSTTAFPLPVWLLTLRSPLFVCPLLASRGVLDCKGTDARPVDRQALMHASWTPASTFSGPGTKARYEAPEYSASSYPVGLWICAVWCPHLTGRAVTVPRLFGIQIRAPRFFRSRSASRVARCGPLPGFFVTAFCPASSHPRAAYHVSVSLDQCLYLSLSCTESAVFRHCCQQYRELTACRLIPRAYLVFASRKHHSFSGWV